MSGSINCDSEEVHKLDRTRKLSKANETALFDFNCMRPVRDMETSPNTTGDSIMGMPKPPASVVGKRPQSTFITVDSAGGPRGAPGEL